MIFPGTEVRLTCQEFLGSSFLPFSKMGTVFPFFQSLTAMTYQISWRLACNYISQFPQDSGMHLVRPHRFTYVQVPQVVMNLIFSHSGRDFAPPIHVLWSVH